MTLAQLSGAVVNDGINGKNNIILSDTAPTDPEEGQLWQDTSSTPEIVRKWEDSTWKTWGLYAPNINVDTLSALAISTGSLTNVYEVNHPTYGKHNGTVKISDDGFKIEDVATLSDGKYKGTKVDITGSTQGTTGIFMQEIPDITVPTKFKQVWYMSDGLYFTDSINSWTSSLTAETLVDTGNLPISASAPFSIAEPLTVRKKNGIVTMAGAVNINGQSGGTMFILPEGFRPLVAKRQLLPLLGGTNYGRVTVNPNGQVNLTANTANLAMDFGPLIFQV